MSTTVSVNGSNFEVPATGERGWGDEVSNLLIELASVSLLIKGGSIPLTSEADFGTNFGLKSIYYKTGTANPASAGVVRLANTDTVKWRNGANNADLTLDIASDRLRYESVNIPTISSTDAFTNKTIDAALNTLSNIDTTMWASGVLNTSTSLTGASDLNVPSTLAVKSYIDNSTLSGNIGYTPASGANWPDPDPTSVQGGLDNLAAERALKTITVTGVNSLTGGGDLSANRTIDIADGGVNTAELADLAVTTAKLDNLSVTSGKLADNSVATAKIIDSNVTNAKLADNAVTTSKITDSNVTTAKIANSNVTSAKLEDNIVFPGNQKVRLPVGTTAQRPVSPAEGDLRRNSQLGQWEGYDGTGWAQLGGGGLEPTPVTHTSFPLSAVAGKYYLVDLSGASGDITMTLPDITTQKESVGVQIVASHATHGLIVASHASDTIDSGTQFTLRTQRDWRVMNAQSASNWALQRPSSGSGAIVGEWESFTITVSNSGSKSFTNAAKGRRVGDSLELDFNLSGNTTASGGGASIFTVNMPSGLTINTSDLASAGSCAGRAYILSPAGLSGQLVNSLIIVNSSTSLRFSEEGTGQHITANDLNSTDATNFTGRFIVPIVEWSNTGTTVALQDLTARTKEINFLSAGLVSSSFTINSAKGRAFRDSTGNYRMEFSFRVDFSSQTLSDTTLITFTGTSFFTGVDSTPLIAFPAPVSTDVRANTSSSGNIVGSSSGAVTLMIVAGSVPLTSKPSWFDANVENAQSIDAQVNLATGTVAGTTLRSDFSLVQRTGSNGSVTAGSPIPFNTNVETLGHFITYSTGTNKWTNVSGKRLWVQINCSLEYTAAISGDIRLYRNDVFERAFNVNPAGTSGDIAGSLSFPIEIGQTFYVSGPPGTIVPTSGQSWCNVHASLI